MMNPLRIRGGRYVHGSSHGRMVKGLPFRITETVAESALKKCRYRYLLAFAQRMFKSPPKRIYLPFYAAGGTVEVRYQAQIREFNKRAQSEVWLAQPNVVGPISVDFTGLKTSTLRMYAGYQFDRRDFEHLLNNLPLTETVPIDTTSSTLAFQPLEVHGTVAQEKYFLPLVQGLFYRELIILIIVLTLIP